MFIIKAFTAIALSQAAGFNAVLPILLVAIISAFTPFFISNGYPAPVELPKALLFITTWWGIALITALTIFESIADKFQGLDNLKHAFIDPFISTLSSAFMTVSVMGTPLQDLIEQGKPSVFNDLPLSVGMTGIPEHGAAFWVSIILLIITGIFITLSFLVIKALLRWVISAIPDMGVSNILISLLEDGIVLISVILAFFAPDPCSALYSFPFQYSCFYYSLSKRRPMRGKRLN